MDNKIVVFSDIDDTLMQTKRKTDLSRKVTVGALNKEAVPNSFMYEGIDTLTNTLIDSNDMEFIPTTARNIESYNRTIFANNKAIKYAILNFGGTILVDGEVDLEWDKKIFNLYSKIEIDRVYNRLENLLNKTNSLNLVVKIIDGYYISIYNKFNLGNQVRIDTILELLKNDECVKDNIYYVHHNGDSFAVLPKFLNKVHAVNYLLDKSKPILTIGLGDSISDLDFMNILDFKMIPKVSNINKKTSIVK